MSQSPPSPLAGSTPSLEQAANVDLSNLLPPLFRICVVILTETHMAPYDDVGPIADSLMMSVTHTMLPLMHREDTKNTRMFETLDLLKAAFGRAYPGLALGFEWQPKDRRSAMFEFKHVTLAQAHDLDALLTILIGPSPLSNYAYAQAHRLGKVH